MSVNAKVIVPLGTDRNAAGDGSGGALTRQVSPGNPGAPLKHRLQPPCL